MKKFYAHFFMALCAMLLVSGMTKANDVIYLLGAQNVWTMSADAAVQLTETEEDSEIYYNESVTFDTGDYIAVYTQIDTSWGLTYRYAGYSGGTTLAPNTTTYLYSDYTLGWESSYYITTGGTYAVTVDMSDTSAMTILIQDDDYEAELPTEAYLFGNDGVWDPTASAGDLTETYEGSGIFTGTMVATANYFGIITAFGESSSDWTTVNASRYGPSSSGTTISVGETLSMTYGTDNSWYVETGVYTVTVDFNENTITLSEYTVDATILSYGYASFSSEYNMTVPDDVTVYMATECDDDYVILTEVETDIIPADEGVIIAGEAGSCTFTYTDSESDADFDGNMLVASSETPTVGEDGDGYTYYGLNANATDAEFAVIATGTELSGNKAYLKVEGESSSEAKTLKISFGNTTGISKAATESATSDGAVYSLQGIKVSSPSKGVYIQDGKKVIIK